MSKHLGEITDTDKARNLSLKIDGSLRIDEMESVLFGTAKALNLVVSHVTTLSRKKYPGNRHWHFKQDLKAKGCLDVTYWPDGGLFWITMRKYEPSWVHQKGSEVFTSIERELSGAKR